MITALIHPPNTAYMLEKTEQQAFVKRIKQNGEIEIVFRVDFEPRWNYYHVSPDHGSYWDFDTACDVAWMAAAGSHHPLCECDKCALMDFF